MPELTLREVADRLGGRVLGDGTRRVSGVAPLAEARADQLSFLANPRYARDAQASAAAAVLVAEGIELPGACLIVVPDPYLALARALEIFHPPARPEPGIHPGAFVPSSCTIGAGSSVQAAAVLGERCRIGDRVTIGAGAVLGDDVRVGDDTVLHPRVTVYASCEVGCRVIVHAGAVLGSDGFGFAREGERHHKIPQVGNVVVEDDVEIGSNATIDRGTFGSTRIGRGTKIDNLVQVGHNVQVGENCILVSQTGISGSTRIGNGVIFAGQSGAAGHLEIGDGARVGAKSAVLRDLPAGAFVIGHPAIEAGRWRRAAALFARLPELRRKLRRLEGGSGDDKED